MRRLLLLVLAFVSIIAVAIRAQSSATLSLQERVTMASQIYHIVSTFFPGLSQQKFDTAYQQYLAVILHTEDRREFDLASMAFVAELHDAHTWFYDHWLNRNYAQPIGFVAYPLAGKWTVVQSEIAQIQAGDVIVDVDRVPIDDFFERNRKYISASSSRDAGVSLFDTPVIFPEKFNVTLKDGRQVSIDRQNDKKTSPPQTTTGRWIVEKQLAYIKVPTFRGFDMQAGAIQYLHQFRDAKALIVDVRGNPGGGQSSAFRAALMNRPYQAWNESSSLHGGPILRSYTSGYPDHVTLTSTDTVVPPNESAYAGRLILLIDRVCSCACEDFVMPFKYSKRATLVGETTTGSYSETRHIDFENGMVLNISAVHHMFPDGSTFEGVGIAPDVPIDMAPDDLKAGRDPALQKAIELAQQP
jgi:carboxyl-terminal processing protease